MGDGPGPVTDATELLDLWDAGGTPDRLAVKAAVKASLATLVETAPGHAV